MDQAERGAGRRRLIVACLVLGVLLLVLAPVLRYVVTPLLAQSPQQSAPSSFTSSGSITTLVDLEQEGTQEPNQAPVPVTRTLTTTPDGAASAQAQAEGADVAVTTTLDQMLTSDGRLVVESQYRLAADRATQQLADCCGVQVDGVEFSMAGAGSPLRLPWFTPPRTYPYLDTTLMAPADMAFIGRDRVDDLEAMKFQQSTGPTSVGTIPAPGALVGSEQPTVRLARTYSVNRTVWVDPTTGIILRTAERIRETLRDDDGKDVVVLLAMTLASTPEQESVQAAAAREQARPVLWAHSYGPAISLVLGGLLLVGAAVGVVLEVRARRVEEDFPDSLATFDDLREAFD